MGNVNASQYRGANGEGIGGIHHTQGATKGRRYRQGVSEKKRKKERREETERKRERESRYLSR